MMGISIDWSCAGNLLQHGLDVIYEDLSQCGLPYDASERTLPARELYLSLRVFPSSALVLHGRYTDSLLSETRITKKSYENYKGEMR